ncbi:uncharacterized protein PFL1_01516 [Pseudozyma flocculosa PF-1]|uniref:DUF7888 domain-containing protein n=1 Tax=Pseudozyma flocculosa TaxID=84751 RepID=A0A5C3FDT1_9BASI|nr:uncharacterized protein PFL1_01516 [Pseudozyma flocculosa PF-1]EPQ31332.1 hypothetical protein PFL1_01516 [Pseudozyma flocculosa PF-1]SPO41797.1 uncharacterized protein PSFLO_07279 [Pseudozyma flocculosa]
MKFFSASSLAVAFAVAGMANAAAIPAQAGQADGNALESRAAAGAAAKFIFKAIGSAAVAESISEAFKTLGSIGKWDQARETFTKNTVQAMWDRRPSQAHAAVCYNMGYTVSNTNEMTPATKVEFSLGSLHTDYDCFYMWGPDNHFNSQGDGGYINLATITQGNCSFDGKTSDVYCA